MTCCIQPGHDEEVSEASPPLPPPPFSPLPLHPASCMQHGAVAMTCCIQLLRNADKGTEDMSSSLPFSLHTSLTLGPVFCMQHGAVAMTFWDMTVGRRP